MQKSKNISTCIIPAAGKGSRWAPVSGYLPKEMLPLIDRPVIEWVVDEAIAAGCNDLIIIINKQKQIIKKYLTKNDRFKKKVNFHFINQEEPLGLTHALSLTKKILGDKLFAVALPDLPTISKKPVLGQLINNYSGNGHLISFSTFPTDTLHFYSECLVELRKDKLLNIIHFCPKSADARPHHPGNKIRMSGRYVFNSSIFKITDHLLSKKVEAEINEVVALKEAVEKGQEVLGIEIQGHTYDTGTPAGYVRANTAFFKKKFAKKL